MEEREAGKEGREGRARRGREREGRQFVEVSKGQDLKRKDGGEEGNERQPNQDTSIWGTRERDGAHHTHTHTHRQVWNNKKKGSEERNLWEVAVCSLAKSNEKKNKGRKKG